MLSGKTLLSNWQNHQNGQSYLMKFKSQVYRQIISNQLGKRQYGCYGKLDVNIKTLYGMTEKFLVETDWTKSVFSTVSRGALAAFGSL